MKLFELARVVFSIWADLHRNPKVQYFIEQSSFLLAENDSNAFGFPKVESVLAFSAD